jgi:hypothetical protein
VVWLLDLGRISFACAEKLLINKRVLDMKLAAAGAELQSHKSG